MPLLLSLPPDAALVPDGDGGAALRSGSQAVHVPVGGIRRAIDRLIAGPVTHEELTRRVTGAGGWVALGRFLALLCELADRRLLSGTLVADGVALATACPIPIDLMVGEDDGAEGQCWLLSRFAYVHRDADAILLETPLSPTRITVHDPRLFEVFLRAGPLALNARRAVGDTAGELMRLLRDAGFLSETDPAGNPLEDARPELRAWEFHDLLFHASSRIGRHDRPYGATFRLKGTLTPPAALKAPMTRTAIRLVRPSLAAIERRDQPFTRVLERRHSERDHGAIPITVDELGRFLFRSARVREIRKVGDFEVARRVYPGGGAAYELEIYLAVNRCNGLSPGLYHYRPGDHCLSRLSRATPDIKALLDAAGQTQHSAPPQILIVVTARVQRLFWKYSGMAYAVVLKDVGVLFQTLHLVAEAMGLAACALGGGNADLFARASGIDYYEEPSVGEFTLGRRVQ
jgi:SagB-type dehydrogenase family enzyme